MTRILTLALLTALLSVSRPCPAQSVAALPPAATSASPITDIAPDISAGPYVLAPADVLEISVQGHEDLHQTVVILDDGTFEFPIAGTLHASGKTVDALQAELTRGVSTVCKDPQVTVRVRDAHPRRISVAGAVHAPGLYSYHPGMRLLELLAACGGPNYTPEQTSATLLTAQGTRSVPVDLVALMSGDAAQNAVLAPGDVLLLTPRDPATSMIQVVGDVLKPGQYPVISGGATVLSLLTDAGGANPTAALSKAQIMHAGHVRTVDLHPLTFNLDAPAGKAMLVAGDTLLVPENKQKVAVLGEVRGPAVYPIPDGETLPISEALARAGGVTDNGDKKQVGILRVGPDGKRTLIAVNAESMLKGNAQIADLDLKTGDILVVPTRHHKQALGEYINQVPGIYTLSHLFTGF